MAIDTVSTLTKMKEAGAFKTYINHIRFPHYKNLVASTRINFTFPLTVFIGQNGTGKSSTLQALYGAPLDKSVGNFWFSTEVDPILEAKNGLRHCFIYGYSNNLAEQLEVLKIRIKRKGNPNYWEPSRPYKIYGMQQMHGKRNPAINMEVTYLDFRGILSAFDKCFYFGSLKGRHSKSKQDYILHQSKRLKRVIDVGDIVSVKGKAQNKKPVIISPTELNDISIILGRSYTKATLIEHSFYDGLGLSVVFETTNYKYSEAFAGSGEIKVVMLVHHLHKAKKGSLILLDEPEVSLHPGAQKRLQKYLLEQCKNKQLQIIVSTHSPNLVEGLPDSAIKVFLQDKSGNVEVREGYTAQQAFWAVGQHTKPFRIFVEDNLAQRILIAALADFGGGEELFIVEFYPGGESSIKRSCIHFSRERPYNTFVVLDGDQFVVPHCDPNKLSQSDLNPAFLEKKIEEQTGCKITFDIDGNSGIGRDDQRVQQQIQYLKYYKDNVKYIPGKTPEEIIWDDEYAKKLLTLNLVDSVKVDEVLKSSSFKDKFLNLSKLISNGNLNSVFDLFIGYAKTKGTANWPAVKALAKELIQGLHNGIS